MTWEELCSVLVQRRLVKPIMNFVHAFSIVILLIASTNSTVIKTKNGRVEGITEYLCNGKQAEAFLGIPYAAPPTGENRFLSPQTVMDWNDTLQANKLPPSCYQAASEEMKKTKWYVSESAESEDCLFLNVWRPNTPSKSRLPVFIWIHGGAYQAGSSNQALYNGSILATEENVIVVTINFRLSMFAYLYLNISSVMGNAGLQDQLQAFKWVQDNIAVFGGDPSRVTIVGESSGAYSVGFHLQNPSAQQLFQNGIMESGPSTVEIASFTEERALNASLTLAQNVNCTSLFSNNRQDLLICLRSKSPEELLAMYRLIPEYIQLDFVPVRNGKEVPYKPTMSAPGLSKNVILGTIPNELSYFIETYIPGQTLSRNTTVSEADLRVLLQVMFQLEEELLQNMIIFQFGNIVSNETEYRKAAVNLVTDFIFVCQTNALANMFSSDKNHIYLYSFTHRPSTGAKFPVPKWAGAVHGDEIPFVFGHPLNSNEGYTEAEARLSKSIMSSWASFARTGDPNVGKTKRKSWPELKPGNGNPYLHFKDGATPKAKYGLEKRKCDFLDTIYPDLLQLQEMLDNVEKPKTGQDN